MKKDKFYLTTASIFSLIAVLHLLRAFYGWKAVIGGWVVPMWLSWAAIIASAYLAYQAFKLNKA